MVGWRLAALNAVVVPLAREYRITLPESAPNLVTGAGIFTSETSSQWTAPSSGESRANLIFGRTPSMTSRFRSAQPNEGERDDRLDARVPIHRLQGGDECVALELGVARIIVVAGART